MNSIEEDSRFNPAVKIKNLDNEKSSSKEKEVFELSTQDSVVGQSHDEPSVSPDLEKHNSCEQEDSMDVGDTFAMFENQIEEEPKGMEYVFNILNIEITKQYRRSYMIFNFKQ
jgi:hypothetical protein